jgi:hypothetical protein
MGQMCTWLDPNSGESAPIHCCCSSRLLPATCACYHSLPAAYHHGEASLSGTIVGLAQDFVGSNNINYLVPQGG